MELGYRIFGYQLIKVIDLPLIQISVLRTSEADVQRVKLLTALIRGEGKGYVIHPMDLYLSDTHNEIREKNLQMVKRFADMADLGLIIHDELMPDGKPLQGENQENFRQGLAELAKICPVSVENARDCQNAVWFWETMAERITFDIGHFESSGMNSLALADSLSQELIAKIDYVHLHRSNGPKPNGLVDHWYLTPDCAEIKTLRKLKERKPDIKVILEVDKAEDIWQSLDALQQGL